MKIGIDLDDTIWKYHEKFFEFYNHNNGTNYIMEDYNQYSLNNFFNITEEEVVILIDKFEESVFFEEVLFLEGFLESFKSISKYHEVYFITARPSKTLDTVIKRMMKFLSENPKIHFVRDSKTNIRKEKSEYCRELGIDIMIDDAFHHLELCSKDGINGLLIDYPWNQKEELPENIIRVKNWKEILFEIKKHENRK